MVEYGSHLSWHNIILWRVWTIYINIFMARTVKKPPEHDINTKGLGVWVLNIIGTPYRIQYDKWHEEFYMN